VRDALRLAVGTLTTVRTRPPARVDRPTAGAAMLLAPLTALPLTVVAVLAHLAVGAGAMPTLVAATLVVGLTALWSRGLHLDGLADTADGLATGVDRERSLEVMRRGDVGPGGVAALLLVLLLPVAALAALLPTRHGAVLAVVALPASRYVLAWGCWHRVPAARPTGLGATVARSVSTLGVAAATCLALGLSVALPTMAGTRWYAGPLVVVAAAVGAGWVLTLCTRRLGGVTGDVLGATVEVALAAGLVMASVL
jgi:adenosylcobinamide-GDP ribazoletransferase